MRESIWHRFPKSNYQELRKIIEKLLELNDETVSQKEKKEISKLIRSIDEGFKTKKNEDLKLDFLIQCIEFCVMVNEKDNEAIKLKKFLDHFCSYTRQTNIR